MFNPFPKCLTLLFFRIRLDSLIKFGFFLEVLTHIARRAYFAKNSDGVHIKSITAFGILADYTSSNGTSYPANTLREPREALKIFSTIHWVLPLLYAVHAINNHVNERYTKGVREENVF